jgi:hypothetical protein
VAYTSDATTLEATATQLATAQGVGTPFEWIAFGGIDSV